jgi:capsular exopolysaccharide synthesis family protein
MPARTGKPGPSLDQAPAVDEAPKRASAARIETSHQSRGTDRLITETPAPIAIAEYRRLAATLIKANPERRSLTIVISSAVPGEGKTLTAANLALTLADAYARRVLLVEADLHRPVFRETFGLARTPGAASSPGFGDSLRAGRLLTSALVQVRPGLTLLPAGRTDADPLGLLTSDRLQAFVDDAVRAFDCVLFDTPPAGLMPDAEMMAKVADTTLLVIRAGKTPYSKVERAIEAIGRERIAGVVLNQVQPGGAHSEQYDDYYGSYVGPSKD